jgi:hypothetical protein
LENERRYYVGLVAGMERRKMHVDIPVKELERKILET